MSSTEQLIQMFNLRRKVDDFVTKTALEMINKKTAFRFEGSGRICRCGNRNPHIPHSTGVYNTVRYGNLDYFCYGVEGEGLHIEILKNITGSAYRPEIYSGFWWIESEQV